MRPTIMEVNIKNFNENINYIQEYVGHKKLIPVIKANGYGTYINKNLELINKFDIVSVAIVQEAVELRKLGFKKEILVLNQPYVGDTKEIEENNITVGISDISFLEESLHL